MSTKMHVGISSRHGQMEAGNGIERRVLLENLKPIINRSLSALLFPHATNHR